CRSYFILCRMRVASEQRLGAHKLPRRAEPALWSVVLDERLLHWVKAVAMREALNGLDRPSVGPHRQMAARIDRFAVHQYRAGSALAAVTTDLGARQAEMIAQ